MRIFLRCLVSCLSVLWLCSSAEAKERCHFYRNFWNPTYHIQRLDHCTRDGKRCGLEVADSYCKTMGYEKATQARIDYNIGLTNYIDSSFQCKGWQCHGFLLITCVGCFLHYPPPLYSYEEQRFAFPRFDHYRIDWCYKKGQGCGKQAAYSYCRRRGYLHLKGYKKESSIAATKTLGSHELCFGRRCQGFSEIYCSR